MKNDVELIVEKVVPGGRGFGRLPDGRPAMISGAFPGERVRLRLVRDRKSYVEAEAELLEGERRVTPGCPVAATCGGCDWIPLELEAQREHKLELLREALRRTGGFDEPPGLRIVTAGEPWGYRTRIRLQLRGGKVGFHAAGSHDLVEIEECLVSAPEVGAALSRLRRALGRGTPLGDEFASVEIRCAPGSSRATYFFARARGRALSARGRALLAELGREDVVVVEGEPGTEAELERFELGECYLLAAPGTFTQVNWAVNRALVREIVEGARRRGARSFADLYCGSGNFSLPLLAAGLTGKGVEASAPSIAALRRAATEQGFEAASFEVGRVTEVARRWARAGERFELVIVDPPRAGAKDALEAIERLTAGTLVMVSCDPVTFARDLRALTGRGLVLEEVLAFDMFPQTHHVECVAWLRRAQAA
jgi:23S rRNA (uracil1939-C5)-methyltransferase